MKSLLFCLLIASVSALFGQDDKAREVLINDGDTSYYMKRYVLCLLNAGWNREQSKKDASEIQEAHLDHINKLVKEGYVCLAGPISDDPNFKGILVFDVESIEAARELESSDPAVKAGRLVMEFHYWWSARGSFLK